MEVSEVQNNNLDPINFYYMEKKSLKHSSKYLVSKCTKKLYLYDFWNVFETSLRCSL